MREERRAEVLAALALIERDLLILEALPDGWKSEISEAVETVEEEGRTRYFCQARRPFITGFAYEGGLAKEPAKLK